MIILATMVSGSAGTVLAPILTPSNSPFAPGYEVEVVCFTPSATIYYTLNGDDPTQGDKSIVSGEKILISSSLILKARAFGVDGDSSEVSTAFYPVTASPYFALRTFTTGISIGDRVLGKGEWRMETVPISHRQHVLGESDSFDSQDSFLSLSSMKTDRVNADADDSSLSLMTAALPPLSVTTSYLGTISGGHASDPYLQWFIEQMYVSPDGTVFTSAGWDEGGHNSSIYRNGHLVGLCGEGGGGTGNGIAGDGTSVYLASSRLAGTFQYGVGRCSLDGKRMPGSIGDSFISITTVSGSLVGIAVSWGELFVADSSAGQIKVYKKDFSSTAVQRSWSVTNPGPMVADGTGNIWMIHPGTSPSIVCMDPSTGAVIKQISDVVDPKGISLDTTGRLMIAENGPDQQIRIYDISGTPVLASTFGAQGGIYSGGGANIGKTGPLRFCWPIAVGADSGGNIYVATTETTLSSYTPAGTLRWTMNGLPQLDLAVIDPADETSVYGYHDHHVLDYGKRAGNEAVYSATTMNPFKYPNDPRMHIYSPVPHVQGVRRLNGQKFLFVSNQGGAPLSVFRFNQETDGEIAIPCAMFASPWNRPWPINAPDGTGLNGQWYWRDVNGDGDQQTNEYFEFRDVYEEALFQVDSAGNVWQVNWGGVTSNPAIYIRKFPFAGLDSNGTPVWGPSQTFPVPAPITMLNNLQYDPVSDTMFLFGYTANYPNDAGATIFSGRVICRFDNWSSTPVLTWQTVLPDWNVPQYNHVRTVNLAGEYLFCAYLKTNMVKVFRASDGSLVGDMIVGGQGADEAWVDSFLGLQAFRRSNGEYIISVERGYTANSVLFQRWRPDVTGPPMPSSLVAVSEGTREAMLTWPDVDGETGYQLERRILGAAGWGEWSEVEASLPANATVYYDRGLSAGAVVSYRLRAINAGGLSDYSPSAHLTTHATDPVVTGRWRLDNSLTDAVGSLNASVTGGGPIYGPGYVSPGLQFDGINDAMIIPSTSSPTDYAMAMWIKLDVVRRTNLWARSCPNGPQCCVTNWLRVSDSGKLEYAMEGATVTGTTTVQPGVWYHVVISAKNYGKMRLIVNGAEEGTAAQIGKMWANGDRYYVGGNAAFSFGTPDGTIDDVRLYDRSLTPMEARSLYINSRNLIGRWTFNNTLGDDAGTTTGVFVNGAPVYQGGVAAGAINLDGVDDLIQLPYTGTPGAYTITFWTRLRTIRATNLVIHTCVNGAQCCCSTWALLDSSGRFCHFESTFQTGSIVAQPETWYHVSISGLSYGQLRLYVNGVEAANPVGVPALWPNGVRYQIGGRGACGTYPIDGVMDDVRIYDRVLTADEIRQVRDSRWE